MLSILAGEMTGPTVAGRKRKAAAAGAPPAYDLSDVVNGRGTPADPIAFLALAEGADAPQAAASLLQLLQLKTWDIIALKQAQPYADILITRTVSEATAASACALPRRVRAHSATSLARASRPVAAQPKFAQALDDCAKGLH